MSVGERFASASAAALLRQLPSVRILISDAIASAVDPYPTPLRESSRRVPARVPTFRESRRPRLHRARTRRAGRRRAGLHEADHRLPLKARKAVKSGDAERVNHRMRAAADHHIRIPATENGRPHRSPACWRRKPSGSSIAGPRAPVRSARCDSGMFGSCSSSRVTFISSIEDGPLHHVEGRVVRLPRRQGAVVKASNRAILRRCRDKFQRDPGRAFVPSSLAAFQACAHAASANCVLRPTPLCGARSET